MGMIRSRYEGVLRSPPINHAELSAVGPRNQVRPRACDPVVYLCFLATALSIRTLSSFRTVLGNVAMFIAPKALDLADVCGALICSVFLTTTRITWMSYRIDHFVIKFRQIIRLWNTRVLKCAFEERWCMCTTFKGPDRPCEASISQVWVWNGVRIRCIDGRDGCVGTSYKAGCWSMRTHSGFQSTT